MSTKFSLSAAAMILAGLGATVLAQDANLSVAPVASLAVASRAPDRNIYLGKLPTAAELTREAAARNVAVVRIEETARRIVVFYQMPDGGITSDAYELMSSAGVPVAPSVPTAPMVPTAPVVPSVPVAPSVPVSSAPAASAATVSVAAPAPAASPTVVVVPTSPAPRVVYYEYPASPVYYSYPVYDPYPRPRASIVVRLVDGFSSLHCGSLLGIRLQALQHGF